MTMSTLEDVKTKLASMSTDELSEVLHATQVALRRQRKEQFNEAVDGYVSLYGKKAGLEEACDDLFKVIAPGVYPGGWSGLLQYANKAAG